jgi:hypothetical protein
LFRLYETKAGRQHRADIEESKNLADSMPEKTQELADKLTRVLEGMNATYPYSNPDCREKLPKSDGVPSALSHTQQGDVVEITYQENGAKVVRADLIYTLNGGDRDEEWLRTLATLSSPGMITAKLPEGATHYYINVIDENNFLVSYPKIVGSERSYTPGALAYGQPSGKAPKSEKFLQLDTNMDEKISEKEYMAPHVSGFTRKDKDGDGVLTREEHSHPSFDRADKDKNGKLSQEEFASIHRRHFTGFDKNDDGYLSPVEMKPSAKKP